ncbi:DUF7827 domain-containing protein [Halobellus clavatus]|uniref:DUF7827 domain-containing protein n=1 Tax=Halobellus clavatus TaxID=660517 RepID=UPI000B7FFAF1|nr:BGTF surface domain-containing protein [Halobellus clavatus]
MDIVKESKNSDPEPLTRGPATEFSIASLGGTTLTDSESVIEIPFSEGLSKAGGEAGGLTRSDNVTVTVDGEDVTDRYALDADGSADGQVVLSAATPLDPGATVSVTIDAVNDSIDTETIRPGSFEVRATDSTVVEGDGDVNAYENTTIAFVTDDGSADVDQPFEVEDEDGAFVFAGETGTGSQVFTFDTATRNWSGAYAIETQLDDGSLDSRTGVTLRALDLAVAVEDRSVATDGSIEGTIESNTADRAVEIGLAADNGAVVAVRNRTLAGNGETAFQFDATELTAAGPGNYTVNVTDSATGVRAVSRSVTVVDAARKTAAFGSAVMHDHAGDIAEIVVDLQYAEAATVTIGSDAAGFRANATVVDESHDGTVRLRFNTEAVAGTTTLPADGGDVFETGPGDGNVSDTVVAADIDDRNALSEVPAPGEYPLSARPGRVADDEATAVGTLLLAEPEVAAVTNWVAPAGVRLTTADDVAAERAAGRLTPATEIAAGDVVVHRIVASGLAGAFARQPGSATEAFFALSGTEDGDRYALDVSQRDETMNREAARLRINESTAHVVADPDNDTYLVSYSLGGPPEVALTGERAVRTTDGSIPATGESFVANFTTHDQGSFVGIDSVARTATAEYTLADGTVQSLGTPVVVAPGPNRSVRGTTNAAPGTALDLRIRSANGSAATYLQTATATVAADGTWRARFDFSDREVGDEFVLRSLVGVVAEADELAVGGEVRVISTTVAAPSTTTSGPGRAGGGGSGGGSGGSGSAPGDRRDPVTTQSSTATATPGPDSVVDSTREFVGGVLGRFVDDANEEPLHSRLRGFDALVAIGGLLLVGLFVVSRRG